MIAASNPLHNGLGEFTLALAAMSGSNIVTLVAFHCQALAAMGGVLISKEWRFLATQNAVDGRNGGEA